MISHDEQTERDKKRQQKRGFVDVTGQRALAQTRAMMLEAIGIDTALLRKTVETQELALDATVKGSRDPNWDARLRAAEAIQDLGVPKVDHANKQGVTRLVVELPDWFKELAQRPRAITKNIEHRVARNDDAVR